MHWLGHLSSRYLGLLKNIRAAGTVPCEWKPEYWYPEDIEDPEDRVIATTLAVALCNDCPIMEQCFTYALETNERYGIWGGSLPSER